MRIYVLYVLILALAIYAWRDWFVSLCGLILLAALMKHPDMPPSFLEIQGLNLWNMLLVAVVVGWHRERTARGLRWDLPRWATMLVVAYIGMVVLAYFRALIDADFFPRSYALSASSITNDYLINSLKIVVPGLLIFDGCRTRRRVTIVLIVTICMPMLYIKPIISRASVNGLWVTGKAEMKSRRKIANAVGFHTNSAAMVLSAGIWGVLALGGLRKRKYHLLIIALAVLAAAYALGLCRSRGGYLAFVCAGIVLGMLMWRHLLYLFPTAIATALLIFPGLGDRIMHGFGQTDVTGQEITNMDDVSAGRTTTIWPPVLDTIGGSPVIGHGRLAILRTDAYNRITDEWGLCPTHPHNAYLEIMLDSGIIGLGIVLSMLGCMFGLSVRFCRNRRDALCRAAGAAGVATVTVWIVMAISGQSFFPKENTHYTWLIFGILLAVWRLQRVRGVSYAMSRSLPQGARRRPMRRTLAVQGRCYLRSVR